METINADQEVDARGWTPTSKSKHAKGTPQIVLGQHPDDDIYDMNHENRGIAVIFNHQNFPRSPSLKERRGTELDRDALRETFSKLKFHVEVYNDYSKSKIEETLQIVSNMDHSKNDCLVIAVLTHGKGLGKLCASDGLYYTTDDLMEHFTGDNCPGLVGKPKLFFIQACRGAKTDSGVLVQTDSACFSREQHVYTLPVMADVLFMYATVEGYYAWRDSKNGSCFIQALVQQLEKHHKEKDLVSILTRVNRQVAIGFTSRSYDEDFHNKKEMCSIVSMLTRELYFQ